MQATGNHGKVLTEPLANELLLCSLLRERVFSEPLASNGLPLWLRYSGFQASCNNTIRPDTHILMGLSFVIRVYYIPDDHRSWQDQGPIKNRKLKEQ
jgi:hypothetical protein